MAWSSSGKLYSWGKISEGCLGYINEDKSDIQIEPRLIESLSEYDICNSCCGIRRSMALTTCGRVFSWGKGDREMSVSQSDYFEPKNLFENKQFKNSSDLSFVQIS
jgi:E3 ubiquitin-protein ligase HERC2